MRHHLIRFTLAAALAATPALATDSSAHDWEGEWHGDHGKRASVQLGPRPFYLVDKLQDGRLKRKLESCANGPFYQTEFSIGHRGGAPLQFPEHTKESHEAGARMGAGILECDVTFTSDRQLVCRHDQCDLHTTTNILVTSLADRCSVPFTPAEFDASGNRTKAASALCCTSDLTLDEFKSLKGKMDASNPNAKTPEEYLGGTASWRTDLYATGGTLLSHKESIELIKSLGAKFTPELKGPNRNAKLQVETVFGSQAAYAQAMIDEYKEARIPPHDVWAQSFDLNDVLYWRKFNWAYGKQAVYLDDRYETITPPLDPNDPSSWKPTMRELAAWGVKIIAPPMPILLTVENGKIVPSKYAKAAKAAGLEIITWTIERSDLRNGASKAGFYYAFDPTGEVIKTDGDMFVALDVLAKQVGILGIFSDWAATVTYYANCMGLK